MEDNNDSRLDGSQYSHGRILSECESRGKAGFSAYCATRRPDELLGKFDDGLERIADRIKILIYIYIIIYLGNGPRNPAQAMWRAAIQGGLLALAGVGSDQKKRAPTVPFFMFSSSIYTTIRCSLSMARLMRWHVSNSPTSRPTFDLLYPWPRRGQTRVDKLARTKERTHVMPSCSPWYLRRGSGSS